MPAFLVAAAFGVFEMYLLFRITTAVVNGNRKVFFLFLLLKLLTYAAAIGLFVFFFLDYMLWCFCGFAVGMPLSAIVIFFIRSCLNNGKNEGNMR